MTLLESNIPGVLGATRQTWRAKSVRDLLVEIIKDNRKASDRELLDKFIERLREEEVYFLAAAEYAFDNALRALRREQPIPERTAELVERAAQRVENAAVHVKRVAQIKAKVALLSIKMPSGKTLAQSTGAECVRAGGWFAAIGKRIKASEIVGNVLDEQTLQRMFKRAG